MFKVINDVQAINAPICKSFTIDYPSYCPKCNQSGEPTNLSAFYIKDKCTVPNMFVTFFCHCCEQVFIGNYGTDGFKIATLDSIEPICNIVKKVFPKNIEEVSPNFCEIYNQAYASQQYSLNDISGIGYRKALEFLVKDYAILLNPNDEEIIKNATLSKCINEYIDSKRIKQLALASAWIGNDETHYTKKHQEYNVDDLVVFIEAMASFINSDLSAMKAEQLINKNQSK